MKNILLLSFSIIIIINCTDNVVTEPEITNQLAGSNWSESFEWRNLVDSVFPVSEDEEQEFVERTSTISFFESSYEVKISPPRRIITIEGDSIYSSLVDDTLYTGSYEIDNDTIKFYNSGLETPTKMSYSLERDSLHLSRVFNVEMLVNDEDTLYVVELLSNGSFVWSYSFFKNEGIFSKN